MLYIIATGSKQAFQWYRSFGSWSWKTLAIHEKVTLGICKSAAITVLIPCRQIDDLVAICTYIVRKLFKGAIQWCITNQILSSIERDISSTIWMIFSALKLSILTTAENEILKFRHQSDYLSANNSNPLNLENNSRSASFEVNPYLYFCFVCLDFC